ncbi:MAG: hypothetical protein EPO08_04965 [Rhodospirillaceae bacterium]|nr:MAG: hypothetical protein EPO08_04965 [Rhodospirillaceae bacterium]
MPKKALNRCIRHLVLSSILSGVTVTSALASPQIVTITDTVDDAATKGTSAYSGYKNTTVGPDGSQIFSDTAIAGQNWGDTLQGSGHPFDTSQIQITRNNSAKTITFDMTTEYSGSDSEAPAGLAKYADLFIDTNTPNTPDSFNYAIALGTQTEAAGVYAAAGTPTAFSANQYDTSQQLWGPQTGFVYGGYAARDSDLAAYQTAETAYTNYQAALATYNTQLAAYNSVVAYNAAVTVNNNNYYACKAIHPHNYNCGSLETLKPLPTDPTAPTVVAAPAPLPEIIPPVRLTSGTMLTDFTVTETSTVVGGVYTSGQYKGQCIVKDIDGNCTYDVKVTVTAASAADLNLFNSFDVFWGTADCSNDAIWGTVATRAVEPGTLFILGCGLLGLLGLSRRRPQMLRAAN